LDGDIFGSDLEYDQVKVVSADSLNNPLKKLNAHQRLTPKKPTY
jgi:hypothetical protein